MCGDTTTSTTPIFYAMFFGEATLTEGSKAGNLRRMADSSKSATRFRKSLLSCEKRRGGIWIWIEIG